MIKPMVFGIGDGDEINRRRKGGFGALIVSFS